MSNSKRRRDAAVVLLAPPANGGEKVWGRISVGEPGAPREEEGATCDGYFTCTNPSQSGFSLQCGARRRQLNMEYAATSWRYSGVPDRSSARGRAQESTARGASIFKLNSLVCSCAGLLPSLNASVYGGYRPKAPFMETGASCAGIREKIFFRGLWGSGLQAGNYRGKPRRYLYKTLSRKLSPLLSARAAGGARGL